MAVIRVTPCAVVTVVVSLGSSCIEARGQIYHDFVANLASKLSELEEEFEASVSAIAVAVMETILIPNESELWQVAPTLFRTENARAITVKVTDAETGPHVGLTDLALHVKTLGTALFKEKEVELAKRCYGAAAQQLLIASHSNKEELSSENMLVMQSCLLNLAACHLRLTEACKSDPSRKRMHAQHAVRCCSQVLQRDPESVKALYRRGCAQFYLSQSDHSIEDLKRCLELDADNKAAKRQLAISIADKEARQDKLAGNLKAMFAS